MKITISAFYWSPIFPLQMTRRWQNFGQPGAVMLDDETAPVSRRYCEMGQYKLMATKIKL